MSELRSAIDLDQLVLHYQPQIEVMTGNVAFVEALVRWQHPERGALGPDEFIPVAESTGLIVPLGGWVLRQALDAVAGWPDPLYVAVNLSPRQLAEPDLFARVRASLADAGVPSTRLVLEVTETAVLQDPTAAARTISALRAFGVRVVIDDFGTGYTSLSFLRDYRLDGLKIDRSFIMNLEYGSSAIVDAILGMARALDLSVTAEGVESQAQIAKLQELGCRYIQGYFVSRPVAPDDLPFMDSGSTI
jgi:EAL domain-containing protein (putative c-di-GMP-specific phosphodiesterase class I)